MVGFVHGGEWDVDYWNMGINENDNSFSSTNSCLFSGSTVLRHYRVLPSESTSLTIV